MLGNNDQTYKNCKADDYIAAYNTESGGNGDANRSPITPPPVL